MSDNGNWWDPYCPCRVTRKNIVMTFLAACCFALVTWTIIVTGEDANTKVMNISYVFIDDTKRIENFNFTLNSEKKVNMAKAAQEKKVKAITGMATKAAENRKTTIRTIKRQKIIHLPLFKIYTVKSEIKAAACIRGRLINEGVLY